LNENITRTYNQISYTFIDVCGVPFGIRRFFVKFELNGRKKQSENIESRSLPCPAWNRGVFFRRRRKKVSKRRISFSLFVRIW